MTKLELDYDAYCLMLTIQNDFFEKHFLECSPQSTSKN